MSEVPPASARLTSRLTSLDALRGFDMLWITGVGDLLVAVVGGSFTILVAWFLHRRKIFLRV